MDEQFFLDIAKIAAPVAQTMIKTRAETVGPTSSTIESRPTPNTEVARTIVENYNMAIATLNEDISRLVSELRRLRDVIHSQAVDLREQDADITQLQKSIDDLQDAVRAALAAQDKLKQRIAELQSQHDSYVELKAGVLFLISVMNHREEISESALGDALNWVRRAAHQLGWT